MYASNILRSPLSLISSPSIKIILRYRDSIVSFAISLNVMGPVVLAFFFRCFIFHFVCCNCWHRCGGVCWVCGIFLCSWYHWFVVCAVIMLCPHVLLFSHSDLWEIAKMTHSWPLIPWSWFPASANSCMLLTSSLFWVLLGVLISLFCGKFGEIYLRQGSQRRSPLEGSRNLWSS